MIINDKVYGRIVGNIIEYMPKDDWFTDGYMVRLTKKQTLHDIRFDEDIEHETGDIVYLKVSDVTFLRGKHDRQ